jgi:hypothetical protein
MWAFWKQVLRDAFWPSIHAIGQTQQTLFFLAISLVVACVLLFWRGGMTALREHLKSRITRTVILVPLLAWLPFFVLSVAKTAYDRWSEADKTSQQQAQELNLNKQQIDNLTSQLARRAAPQARQTETVSYG